MPGCCRIPDQDHVRWHFARRVIPGFVEWACHAGDVPKRNQPFQRLIAMVVELVEDGEEVRESVEFPDPVTGQPREVDIVVVRGKLNGQPVRIGIECVDHSSSQKKTKPKADVPWVEGQDNKHRRLGRVDKLLLVSKTGFWSTATQVAESLGHRAITPKITKSELADVLNELFWVRIKVAEVSLKTATFSAARPNDGFQPVWEGGDPWYQTHDGSDRIPCTELYQKLSMQDVGNDLSHFFEDGPSTRDHTSTIDNPKHEGERVHLRMTNGHDEVVVPVDRIVVNVRVYSSETVKSNLTETGEYDGHPFLTGVTPIDGKDARFVVTDAPGGGTKMMGKFDYDFGKRAKADNQRNTKQRKKKRK
jgi:hypothetical protein